MPEYVINFLRISLNICYIAIAIIFVVFMFFAIKVLIQQIRIERETKDK